MTPMLLLLLILQQIPDGSGQFGVLMRGSAFADLREGLSSMRSDTLTAVPCASLKADGFSLEATGALEYLPDSGDACFRPLTAGAFYRWQGSPWISGGVFRGLRQPFLAGLSRPLIEWNSRDVSGLDGVSASAGGLLGFSGWWNQYSDSLSWYGISSPWLGFGMVSWNSFEEDSTVMSTISGFADLRYLDPWFTFIEEDDEWSGEVEIRGYRPVREPLMTLELVPGASWSADSASLGLGAYVTGGARAYSGFFEISADPDSLEDLRIEAGGDMLSRALVHWSGGCSFHAPDTFSGRISGFLRTSPAGCGASVQTFGDSVSVTATAAYSPVRSVSSFLSVSSDLDPDSPDPECTFGVFGSSSAGIAGITIEWSEGITELDLGVSAWIN